MIIAKMTKIKIPSSGEMFSVKTDLKLEPGNQVMIEYNSIIEEAIVLCDKKCPKTTIENNEIKILRIFTEKDELLKKELKQKVLPYLEEAQKKVFRHGLSMEIINAEMNLDGKKLTFYFTAAGRVDFRGLVSDMAGDFGKIIRLQQISPREETQILGGFGICGQVLCCKRFLKDFDGISSAPTKNIGCCGRPMCCLSFEEKKEKE